MEVFHYFSLIFGAFLSCGWIILLMMALGDREGGGPLGLLIKKWNWLKYPIGLLGLLFIARIWWVAMTDLQDFINGLFSLFGCAPIDIFKHYSV